MTDFIVVREAHMNYPDVNLSATERLQQILGSVIMLVRGEIDNPMFEEECHQLVGAGGYVLYTVDKVLLSCLKHLHTAFTEPLCRSWFIVLRRLAMLSLFNEKKLSLSMDIGIKCYKFSRIIVNPFSVLIV